MAPLLRRREDDLYRVSMRRDEAALSMASDFIDTFHQAYWSHAWRDTH